MIKDKEQIEIDNNNELIAIFDGWESANRLGVHCFAKDDYRKYHCDLKYHSDWNELMRIWVKFRDLKITDLKVQMILKAEIEHSVFIENIAYNICFQNIERAFQSIVSGIQWYNQLKQ